LASAFTQFIYNYTICQFRLVVPSRAASSGLEHGGYGMTMGSASSTRPCYSRQSGDAGMTRRIQKNSRVIPDP
jgi:hypothetical protein